jgi:hypothetical protein
LTNPNEPKKSNKIPAPPRKPATTWVPFSIRDSNALERAHALTQPIREEKAQQQSGQQDGNKRISEDLPPFSQQQQQQYSRQDPPSRLQVPDANGQFHTTSSTVTTGGGDSILVNEDYLFEVNIHKMEIKPVSGSTPFFSCFVFFVENDTFLREKTDARTKQKRLPRETNQVKPVSPHLLQIGLLGWPHL